MNSLQPSPTKDVVGRESQLMQLEEMLSGTGSNHVLTIEAPRGMGKSHLLRKIAKLGRTHQHMLVELDFRRGTDIDTLFLIRQIRDQLDQQGGLEVADKVALLNKAINEHTHSRNYPTAIGLEGKIQTVSVNLDTLKHNLHQLKNEQLVELSEGLNILPPAGGELEKNVLVNHLVSEAKRLDLLADLVVSGQQIDSQIAWWDAGQQHAGGVVDIGGSLNQADLLARRLAIGEVSRSLFRMVTAIAAKRPILLLVDSWGAAGEESQKWLFHWLIKPLCREQLKGVKMVVAGRNLTPLRVIDLNASHTRLGPLSLNETRQLLIDKMGFHPDSDIDAIYAWTKGIPSVLETLIALNRLGEVDGPPGGNLHGEN